MATAPEIPCAATISFDAAQAIVREGAVPLGLEWVPLAKAGRRILARAAVAQIDSPRRDSAAMDGFAVRSQDLAGEVTRLKLCGESFAGGQTPSPLLPGTAIRISTGAPMPPGADRVVIREYTRVEGGEVIVPRASGKPHVRLRASDFALGTALLAPGTRIDARTMVVAAAADLDRLPVWRRPRLHILTNGDELAPPGRAGANEDAIPDSLSEALLLMARQWGAKPVGASRSGDRIDDLRAAAQLALGEADVIVMVGGASDGTRDRTRAALMPLGLQLLFSGVAMKPGKPLWYGRIGKTHVLGLPGNPTAALTTARLFLAPLICALSGAGFDYALRWCERVLLEDVPAGRERDQFLCGIADEILDGVTIIERQQASAQMMLAQAELLVERRSGAQFAASGTMLRCLRF
ncbi:MULTISPECIES: molybdopterin molybdotransferase MoeA [unclassified Novosphingobium]|uniref:molybdopterin molybdotransferase MoeA n=1 Tax=unclassified Novosphingobium TaxID=2644732 RepID=UPI00135B1DC2|nr:MULTISPECIES: molybdopterin molybdotransferase MoeA [unclassified Novosphingobium]